MSYSFNLKLLFTWLSFASIALWPVMQTKAQNNNEMALFNVFNNNPTGLLKDALFSFADNPHINLAGISPVCKEQFLNFTSV